MHAMDQTTALLTSFLLLCYSFQMNKTMLLRHGLTLSPVQRLPGSAVLLTGQCCLPCTSYDVLYVEDLRVFVYIHHSATVINVCMTSSECMLT